MDSIDKLIRAISLPIDLPREAFYWFGEPQYLPDISTVIAQLPATIHLHLDLEANAVHRSYPGYSLHFLPLLDGAYLKIKLQQQAIVELTTIRHKETTHAA